MKIKNWDAYLWDCLEIMDNLIEQWIQVDAIITDPPYWTTACKRDQVIPFDKMRERLNKLIKPNGAIVLFWSEPFSSALRMSNIKMYKYDWVWDKKIPSGMSFSKYQPMRQTECISIFCDWKTIYNAQMIKRDKPIKWWWMKASDSAMTNWYKALKKTYDFKNPTNVLIFDKIRKWSLHPTQKPVALIEYLIKTYTNEWELILDFTAGSFTTAVACENTNRKRICIEKDEWYYNIWIERVNGDTN